MDERTCTKCGMTKPLDGFYRQSPARGGHAHQCKECVKAYTRSRSMLPHNVASRAAYQQTEHGKAVTDESRKRWRQKAGNRDKESAQTKVYKQTPAGKASAIRSVRTDEKKRPERHKARKALNYATRHGYIVPWPVCALAECDGKPESHHPDYSRPLDVVWLCPKHHKQAHALLKEPS